MGQDCEPVLPSGISGRTRIIRLAEGDCVPTLPSGISGRTRIIRLAEGDCEPVLPSGISGRTRIVRRADVGCFDIFDRDTWPGWGTPTHGLNDWVFTFGQDEEDWSVWWGIGEFYQGIGRPITSHAMSIALDCGKALPYEALINLRNNSPTVFYLAAIPIDIRFRGLNVHGDAISAGMDTWDWYQSPSGPHRTQFGAGAVGWPGAVNEYTTLAEGEISPALTRYEWGWWRIYVDEYGTYCRVWREDGEDEFAHLAARQPADEFGDGITRGRGESWTCWFAWEDPIEPGYVFDEFRLTLRGMSTATHWTDYEVAMVQLLRGACCA